MEMSASTGFHLGLYGYSKIKRTITKEEKHLLSVVFHEADEGNKGFLTREDVKVAIAELFGYKPSKYEVDQVMNNYGSKWNNAIGLSLENYMIIMSDKMVSADEDENIRHTFMAFDTQCRGFLGVEDLQRAFSQVAPHIPNHTVQSCFRVHHVNKHKKRKFGHKDQERVKKTKLKQTTKLKEEMHKFIHETEESNSEDNAESETNGSDNEEEEEADEFAAIKKELSNLSFEELKKLKEKLGLKVFNRVLHGDRGGQTAEKKAFKRANKNRPMEITSKKPVPRFKTTAPVKKKVTRDPRFDDLSGQFNEELFNKSYGFLSDIKHREREKVQKAHRKEKNPDKKKELQLLLNRMKQEELAASRKDKQKTIEKDWKKKEQTRVKEGKTPFYLKKSEKRKLELAEKYKELQKSGKVEKYLGKKRKKTAQKEKKKLPVQAH